MSEEREFKVSGGALQTRRKRSTRKNRQEGGDNSGGLMQLANQSAPAFTADLDTQKLTAEFQSQVGKILSSQIGPDKIQQFGGKKSQSQKGGDSTGATVNLSSTRSTPGSQEVTPVVSGVSPSQPAPVGGARLLPPKRKTRVALKHKKSSGGGASNSIEMTNVPPVPSGGAHSPAHKVAHGGSSSSTRKARKIHLGVKGVTLRLKKAKKAKELAMKAPISIVKAKLQAAGIIKKGSKAPESILRNTYADLLIMKKGL